MRGASFELDLKKLEELSLNELIEVVNNLYLGYTIYNLEETKKYFEDYCNKHGVESMIEEFMDTLKESYNPVYYSDSTYLVEKDFNGQCFSQEEELKDIILDLIFNGYEDLSSEEVEYLKGVL